MKNKKPEIRFKGFSEEWEEHKFENDIVSIQTGTNLLGSTTNIGMPLLKMGNIQRGFFSLDKVEFLDENVEIEKENIAYYGDFFFNTRNTLELVGKGATWIGESGKFAFNNNIARFEFRGIDTVFFNYLYNTQNIISQVHARAMGTTSVAAIYPRNLNSIEYYLPSNEEQTQIGNFFKNLDNLITLHQRKYEKLGILKKAMLEKMFPRKITSADNPTSGRFQTSPMLNIPEIRFKGFSGAWEEKTLGEIAEIKTGPFGSTLHAEDYVEDGEPIITTEHFKSGELPNNKKGIPQVSSYDYSRLKSYLLKSGDIVFSRVGSVDINAHVKDSQDGWLFSGRVLRVRTTKSIDSEFLHQELSTTRVRNNVIMRAVGQTMPSINTEILRITPVQIPKNIKEQEKIGNYFKNLDNLLTLHRGELEKLKNLKKALLEKMFV